MKRRKKSVATAEWVKGAAILVIAFGFVEVCKHVLSDEPVKTETRAVAAPPSITPVDAASSKLAAPPSLAVIQIDCLDVARAQLPQGGSLANTPPIGAMLQMPTRGTTSAKWSSTWLDENGSRHV